MMRHLAKLPLDAMQRRTSDQRQLICSSSSMVRSPDTVSGPAVLAIALANMPAWRSGVMSWKSGCDCRDLRASPADMRCATGRHGRGRVCIGRALRASHRMAERVRTSANARKHGYLRHRGRLNCVFHRSVAPDCRTQYDRFRFRILDEAEASRHRQANHRSGDLLAFVR